MTTDEAIAKIYYIAESLATIANSSKGLPSVQISADLQETNRKLQEALEMYEVIRGSP